MVWSFAGVRSLYDDGSKRAQDVSRDYVLTLDESAGRAPLLTVYGGKITTYRRLAEQALERLAHLIPAGPAWTVDSHLPGGELPHDGLEAHPQMLARVVVQNDNRQVKHRHGNQSPVTFAAMATRVILNVL